MKSKIVLILSCFLLLISCVNIDDEDYNNKDGFIFIIANKTGKEYNKAKLTIGGLKNGKFIATDSLTFPKIRIDDNWPDTTRTRGQFVAVGKNRWKPNLNKIKEIPSDSVYFMMQFKTEEIYLFDRFKKNKLFSNSIYREKNLINSGRLSIAFKNNKVFGSLSQVE